MVWALLVAMDCILLPCNYSAGVSFWAFLSFGFIVMLPAVKRKDTVHTDNTALLIGFTEVLLDVRHCIV